jgi:glyoxylase-like metal-dependent hydrolase (beta-lactamase superfamily II)
MSQTEVRDAAAPTSGRRAWPREFAPGVAYLRTGIANLFFVGPEGAGDRGWVLIDAGVPGYTGSIVAAAAERFGAGARPSAILMTHGHFDHVGALETLAAEWDVPVYAHDLEMPYLTGRASYPPPDPTVGGGMMATLSWMYPRGPVDVEERAYSLPADGTVPGLPGWRWIATPGHSPGHVSFFRDDDRTLIAGDAFVTTRQESALSVLTQRPEVNGPPAYFTQDWELARRSVEALAALKPAIAGTGHGVPMRGRELQDALLALAVDFARDTVPSQGRYVGQPAIFGPQGVIFTPRDVPHPMLHALAGLGLGFAAGWAMRTWNGRGA